MHFHTKNGQRGLLLSTLLNFIITIVQVAGGILSNSLSLLSDALHNLGDTIAVFLAYIADRFGNKPANERKTFGYKRIEIIAAFINASVLIIISVLLFIEAISRFADPEPVKGKIMLIVASVGLIANLLSVYILNPHKKTNINIKAAYLHLLGDTFSSFAVIIGGIAITFWKIYWIDPVITIGIGIYLIFHTFGILKTSFNVLMQSSPENIKLKDVKAEIENFDEVCDVHHIHLWNLDEKRIFLECHIGLCNDHKVSETEKLTAKIKKGLLNKYNIRHLTVQYEFRECSDEI